MSTYNNWPNGEDVLRAVNHGDVTEWGVSFLWSFAGSEGARFTLIREPFHTDEDIEKSKQQLKRDRDVVGAISVARIK